VSCNEIPTTNEILDISEDWQNIDPVDNSVILRGNTLNGPWASKDAYLRAHFEMLREDASRALREAVRWVNTFPTAGEDFKPGSDIGIYSRVHVTAITFSYRGLGFRVAFSLSKVGKKIRWEQSKRLLTGSIVALTPESDMFRTNCIVAVVAARPLEGLNQPGFPKIDLFIANPKQIEIDPGIEFIMVEDRSSFFEAERHTMTALQKMMSEPFPLSEHLVDVQSTVGPPNYVLRQPVKNLSPVFFSEITDQCNNVDVINGWPENGKTILDKSQEGALRRFLTKRVAIIHGPPGTGKTRVSVMALETMLNNMASSDPPIIVACQTNHALDQLLLHVASFEENFARLGGRSKDQDVIKKRTLYALREGKRVHVPGGMRHTAKNRLDDLTKQMIDALMPLQMGKSSLDPKVLFKYHLLTAAQCESLTKGGSVIPSGQPPFRQWLDKKFEENTQRTCEPDGLEYEYEEVDLEFEQIKEIEAEAHAQDDDDIDFETLHGRTISLWDPLVGTFGHANNISDDEARDLLKNQDLYKIPAKYRLFVYNYLQRQLKDQIQQFIREHAVEYNKEVIRFRAGGWERDATLLTRLGIKLIGLTTTGLSKYRALISALSPRIVVIEEAAETMEAPVISACVPSLEQLILVGDHKQLRPQCAVKELQDPPFSLNVSMFERLIDNHLEHSMLKRQRRMIPEIRRILKPIYGEQIVDHPSTTDLKLRPPVPGLGGCNSFFYSHSWPEGVDNHMSSMNPMEADMVTGFFDYLIHNGMTEKQITVLTFYHGQRKLLLRKLREHPRLGKGRIYKVVTVDSFQGEENDVILLSMVRSNKCGRIGFLGIENRVCVALSRAKRGLYIFGNAELLCSESKLWAKVITMMAGKYSELAITDPQCRVVFRIPLLCANHGRKTWIKGMFHAAFLIVQGAKKVADPDEWETTNGGCQMKCEHQLDCGHKCQLTCHPFDHEFVICGEFCMKLLPCGHICAGICDDICFCAQCKLKHGDCTDSFLRQSVSQDTSGVMHLKSFANGGYKRHDTDEIFLNQQAEHIGTSFDLRISPMVFSSPLAQPKYPAPPQHSPRKGRSKKSPGVKNSINKVVSRGNISLSHTLTKSWVEAVAVETDLLIDLS
jgi:helicase required for RNAi-mediated heterochromatin assembly 1